MKNNRKEASSPIDENGISHAASFGCGYQYNFEQQQQQQHQPQHQNNFEFTPQQQPALPQNYYVHTSVAPALPQASPQPFFAPPQPSGVVICPPASSSGACDVKLSDEDIDNFIQVARRNSESNVAWDQKSDADGIYFDVPGANPGVNFNSDDFDRFLEVVATVNDDSVIEPPPDSELIEPPPQNNYLVTDPTPTIVPLRQWVLNQSQMNSGLDRQKIVLIKKVTVAYSIGKLLQHMKDSVSSYSQAELLRLCSVDNFAVHVSAADATNELQVVGIDMISPSSSLQVVSSAFASSTNEIENWGRSVDTFITKHSPFCCAKPAAQDEQREDSSLCYSLGVLLHFLLSGKENASFSTIMHGTCNIMWGSGNIMGSGLQNNGENLMTAMSPHSNPQNNGAEEDGSSRPAKLNCMPSQLQDENNFSRNMSLSGHNDYSFSGQDTRPAITNFPSLQSLGCPPNLSLLVKNLLDCESDVGVFRPDDSYPSLEVAIDDMSRLLCEPNIFLFETNAPILKITKDKLYGRTSEAASLTDAFFRVAASGQSEAFVVGGFSGCGKTRLVQSAFQSVLLANGMLVTRKFDETTNNQLSVVLAAFDDLCVLLAENSSVSSLQHIWQRLMSEFGTNIHLLARLLPNVLRLAPSPSAALMIDGSLLSQGEVNFFSLCDNIKRFMRVVSSSSCPFFLFLDDLQWADPVSLGLVHTVLSDKKGASCVFFVGSYRDNEVKPDHIIFGFYEKLSEFDVPLNTLHLDGMLENEVNAMISDTLGMFPRLCRSLSQLVFRKTNGNPFFVQTFLRSLVDKGRLNYSLRKKTWTWDVDEIYSENVTPNVLDLVSAKMTDLTQNLQTALKVASCFGISIKVSIVQDLLVTPQYHSLLHDLNETVMEGFMDIDTNKLNYRFVHDKVREAAYGMIRCDDKRRFHFDIGMALLSTHKHQTEGKSDTLFVMIEQINYGVPSLLHDQSQRISVAKLNLEAAANAMQSYNYTSGYRHAKAATSLLPDDSWTAHHDLSLKSHFQLAKSAYPYSKIDEARDSLELVLEHADSLQTRLDAYDLLHSIILSSCAPKDFGRLLITIADLLRSLGEDLPSDDDLIRKDLANEVKAAKKLFEEKSDDSLLNMYVSGSESQVAILHAYNILAQLAYIVNPKLFPYFAARGVQYCLNSKVACKYIPELFTTFAIVLCEDMSSPDVRVGYRIGRLALSMLNQNISLLSELPMVYLLYYGHIGILFEPIQACIEMHRWAYEIGLQLGNASISAFHKQFVIVRELHAGTNLLRLKEEMEFDMKMAKHHSLPILGMKSKLYHEAVLNLIECESSMPRDLDRDGMYDSDTAYTLRCMVTSTYLGYFERVRHMAENWELSSDPNKRFINVRNVYIYFYYGIALIALRRRKKSKKMPDNIKTTSDIIENAALLSEYNFRNKAALLNAEKSSLLDENIEAEAAYNASIAAAQSSKFVHEEGLACELAGGHFQRLGNIKSAVSLFQQAEQCYKTWGSQRKSLQMAEKVRRFACKGSR